MDVHEQIIRLKAQRAKLEQELRQLEITADAEVMAINRIVDGLTPLSEMDIPAAAVHMAELQKKHARALEIRGILAKIARALEG